jgi:hypothetical protein
MNQIIGTDTVWAADSVHDLTGNVVQIAPTAKLTIQPGAIVLGGQIAVFGSLQVAGSAQSPVYLNGVKITEDGSTNQPGRIDVDHAVMTGGSFLPPTGNAVYGSFSLTRDSCFGNA